MKPRCTELREPTCCCIGVRRMTFFFSLLQAGLLFFSLSVFLIAILRVAYSPNGYYTTDSDADVLAVYMRDEAYADSVEESLHSAADRAEEIAESDKSVDFTTSDSASLLALDGEEADEEAYRGIQLRIADEAYEAGGPNLSSCRGRRDAFLVLGTVGTALCLTVLVLIGVWRAKPTYLLPYCCMLLCDLVLTAGLLLTACLYIRNAREWIALQRYVDMVFKEHLLRLSDLELHAILMLIGGGMFVLKTLWFVIVCRCYSYLVEVNNRRLLSKFGLVETGRFAPGHHRAGSVGLVRVEASEPVMKHSRNRSEIPFPITLLPPPSYSDLQRSPAELDKLLQTKQE